MTREQLLEKISLCAENNTAIYKAFEKIDRKLFVPEEYKEYAYEDRPLPIGSVQTISQPTMICIMLKVLDINPHNSVLEIGTGSGYTTALISQLAKKVYTIERLAELSYRAQKIFESLNLSNVKCKIGDGTIGWEEFAPYDRIIVTAAFDVIPETLIKQLKVSGILLTPVKSGNSQYILKIKKLPDRIEESIISECNFVEII